jgi:hypothetical protein
MKVYKLLSIGIILTGVILSGCACIPGQSETPKSSSAIRHEEKADRDFIEQTKVTFDGGEAVVGLYDDLATREFMQWQPIVFTMQHDPGMIVMTGFPDEVFKRDVENGLTPRNGDIALDLKKKRVVIFLQDEPHSGDLIAIGRVVSGIEDLSTSQGSFQAYLMPTKKQGKAKL